MGERWTINCNGIDWPCRTEQDALGVLVHLRDFGRRPVGIITITPEPSAAMTTLLATLPSQSQGALL